MKACLRRKLCLCFFFFIAHSSWFPDFYSGRTQTTCEIHLAERNYEDGIAATMPNLANGDRAIVTTGPSTNIFCMCEQIERYSMQVMRCRILCNNEEMFRVVNNRVDPPDPEDAHPFFRSTVLSDVIGNGPKYVYNDRDPPLPGPPIWALITVLDAPHFPPYVFFFEDGSSSGDSYDITSERNEITSESPSIQRTQSYPNSLKDRIRISASEGRKRSGSSISKFHYVEDYVTLQVCTGGTPGVACPIMHNEFEVGQIVYILKIEIDKVKEGQSVACISAEGLMKMNRRAEEYKQSGFRDPLRRTGDKSLTIDDYRAYIISDTPERTSWIVQPNAADSSSTPGSSASHAQQDSIVDSFNALQMQGGKTPEKSPPKPESNVSTTFTSNYKLIFNMLLFFILFITLFTFITHKHDRTIEDTKLALI